MCIEIQSSRLYQACGKGICLGDFFMRSLISKTEKDISQPDWSFHCDLHCREPDKGGSAEFEEPDTVDIAGTSEKMIRSERQMKTKPTFKREAGKRLPNKCNGEGGVTSLATTWLSKVGCCEVYTLICLCFLSRPVWLGNFWITRASASHRLTKLTIVRIQEES